MALHDLASPTSLEDWAEEFGSTYALLGDPDKEVWDQYRDGGIKPQYIVFDRDMTIVFKGWGDFDHGDAEDEVLDRL